MEFDPNVLEDLHGENYGLMLLKLHELTGHKAYLEIGSLTGASLLMSKAPSIAIDPNFRIEHEVIGSKPLCLFYQMGSDEFFERYDAPSLLGRPVEFSFLDGLHHCEFLLRDFFNTEAVSSRSGVIAMHDCVPLDIPMTDRVQEGTPPSSPHRLGWWTGDVWRAALVIKRHRPDLRFTAMDCQPTGLIVITGLDPTSTLLKDNYDALVAEMNAMNLEEITIRGLHEELGIVSAQALVNAGLAASLGLAG
jgi:hypothetical protein